MNSNTNKRLIKQIYDAAGNVVYTYSAHWIIAKRLERQANTIKIVQIVLTALSTGGFLTSLIAGIPYLSWVGGFTSAIALGLNLYSLNFKLPDEIKVHTDAANALWDAREEYKSLIIDSELLTTEEIRERRDSITKTVSSINKMYPGTDNKSFAKAQKEIGKYIFGEEEAAKILGIDAECN